MDADTLMDAVRLGFKMDLVHPRRSRRKGMFGLGMKTASASLGRYWEVVSRPRGGTREYRVAFDLKEWRGHAGERDFRWEAVLEEDDPDRAGPLGDYPHGTAVVVTRLRESHPLAAPVMVRLGNAYKPHLEAGDTITVNGASAEPRPYDLVDGTRVSIDLTTGANSEHRITGWVGLDRQTHNAGDFGLNLYRQDQLIEPWNKEWFAVHLMTSRIMGEITLDFVPANFHKRGFQKQSPEWKLATEVMKEHLRPIVRASREMSRGRGDATRVVRAIGGLRQALGAAVAEGVPLDITAVDSPEPGPDGRDRTAKPAPPPAVEVTADTLVLPDGVVRLSYRVEELLSPEMPWDYIYDRQRSELQTILNVASPLFERVTDTKFLATLALADSVSRFLAERRGFTPDEARRTRDRWLFRAVSPVIDAVDDKAAKSDPTP